MTTATPEKTVEKKIDPKQPPRKKRRVLRKLFLFGLVLFAAVAFLPQVIARTSLRNQLVPRLLPELEGQLSFGSTSLGWIQPIEIENVTLLDDEGRTLGRVGHIESSYSLLDLLLEPSDLGTWKVERSKLEIHYGPGRSNLQTLLDKFATDEPAAAMNFALELTDAEVKLIETATSSENVYRIPTLSYVEDRSARQTLKWTLQAVAESIDPENQLSFVCEVTPTPGGTLSATRFPLGQFQPALVWNERSETVAGLLDGEWTVGSASPEKAVRYQGSGGVTGLKICRGAESLLDLETVSLQLASDMQPDGLHVSELACGTDFGSLKLNGELVLPASAVESDSTGLIEQLLGQSFELSGRADLAELSRRFPGLVTLQEGVELQRGECQFLARSQPEGERRVLQSSLTVTQIVAQTPEQQIDWPEPFSAAVQVSEQEQNWSLDELRLISQGIELRGAGTFEKATLNADVRLAEFAREWGRVIDFGTLRPTGTLTGNATSTRTAENQYGLQGLLTGENLSLGIPDDPRWSLERLRCEWNGAGTISSDKQYQLDQFAATMTTGRDQLRLALVPQTGQQKSEWKIDGAGNLDGFARKLIPLSPGDRLSGQYQLSTLLAAETDRYAARDVSLSVENFSLRTATRSLQEAQVILAGDALYRPSTGRIEANELTLSCPTLAARINDLTLGRDAKKLPYQLAGSFAGRGRIERLLAIAGIDIGQESPTGMLNVQVSANPEQQTTALQWKITTEDLRWPVVNETIPTRPVTYSPNASDATPQLGELLWTGAGTYSPNEELLKLSQTQLDTDFLKFDLAGELTQLSTTPLLNLQGTCEYEWAILSQRFPQFFPENLQIAGHKQTPVSLTLPLSGTSGQSARAGNVTIAWDSISWASLPVGPGNVALNLQPTQLTVSPLQLAIAEGTARVSPVIHFTEQGAVLMQQPERLLDRVQLTEEICEEFLKYVSPMTSDATRVNGSFSLDNSQPLVVPLSNYQQMTGQGVLQIHQAQMKPGPLTLQFAALGSQIDALRKGAGGVPPAQADPRSLLTIEQQAVPYEIRNGRVFHRDLKFKIKDLDVVSSGSVGFDDTIDMVAEMEIPASWTVRGRPIQEFWGPTVKIPVRGTLSRPQMDQRVVGQLLDQLVRGAVTNFLGNEINKQLNNLFKPR